MQISNGWIEGKGWKRYIFDTHGMSYAPVIDYSTVRFLISLAFGNKWECFTGIHQWHLQMQRLKKKFMLYPQKIPDDICHGY